jgi:hypothetical protein
MNLLVVTLSLLTGLIRGYRIDDLLSYPFRGLPQFFVSLGLQLVLGTSWAERTVWMRAAGPMLNLGSMGLLIWALASNWDLYGARLAACGVLANLAVIFANGGKMPVSLEALRIVGMPATRVAYLVAGLSLTHRPMRPGTALWLLGDLLYLPPQLARSSVFSIGDIILAGGVFLFIQDAMSKSAARRLRRAAPPSEPSEPPPPVE